MTRNATKLKKKIFVAGHKGLIGSAVLKKLIESGYKNIRTEKKVNLDLTNYEETLSFFKKNDFDYVILAAGYTGGILENKKNAHELLNQNLQIQLNIFSISYMVNIKKLIFFASSCMYPKYCQQPLSEELLLTGKPDKTSLSYALAKLTGVEMCKNYNNLFKSNRFISLIPNTVYGPNDNFNYETGHVLSSLISRFEAAVRQKKTSITLWGSGRVKREFLYSSDLASMCKIILDKENLPTYVINVGSGDEISINELSKKIAKILDYKGNILWDCSKPDGVPRKLLSSKNARSLGWIPEVKLDAGIMNTCKWYKNNLIKLSS